MHACKNKRTDAIQVVNALLINGADTNSKNKVGVE